MPKTREETNRSITKKEVLEDLLSVSTGLCMFPTYEESNQRAVTSNAKQGARDGVGVDVEDNKAQT